MDFVHQGYLLNVMGVRAGSKDYSEAVYYQRYFTLDRRCLKYYETKEAMNAGKPCLCSVSCFNMSVQVSGAQRGYFHFEITDSNGRRTILCADSSALRGEWMLKIASNLQHMTEDARDSEALDASGDDYHVDGEYSIMTPEAHEVGEGGLLKGDPRSWKKNVENQRKQKSSVRLRFRYFSSFFVLGIFLRTKGQHNSKCLSALRIICFWTEAFVHRDTVCCQRYTAATQT
jgi:hypothetical protein